MRRLGLSLIILSLAVACQQAEPSGPLTTESSAPIEERTAVPQGAEQPDAAAEVSEDAAVYLSLGDSLQYGCCLPQDPQLSAHPAFARYLSGRLNRPVQWVTLAGNDTTFDFIFINGVGDNPPQLDRAVTVLEEYRRQGRAVVAITLSIGGNDLLELSPICRGQGGSSAACLDAFAALLDRYVDQLSIIQERLNQAKDPNTPLLQLNVYDPMDCGRPGDDVSSSALGVQIFNQRIQGLATINGVVLIDMYTAFKGKACQYIRDVDPTLEGYAVIARLFREAYEALPPRYVEPFVIR